MNWRSGNALGLGLVVVGVVVMVVAAFLPLQDPAGMSALIRNNTLIQQGGWLLIAVALAIAVSAFWVSRRAPALWIVPVVLCVLAAVGLVAYGNNKDWRTLYPVSPDGTLDMSQPGIVAPLGITLYVACVGVFIALTGLVIIRARLMQSAAPPRAGETR